VAAQRVRVQACGDAWVMVDWGSHVKANTAARALAARLRESPEPFAIEVVAGVRTLALRLATGAAFEHRAKHRAEAIRWLQQIAPHALDWDAPAGREVVFPACYDPSMAPDLDEVAAATGLTTAEVALIMTQDKYAPDLDKAEDALIAATGDGQAHRLPFGHDALWVPSAPVALAMAEEPLGEAPRWAPRGR
jgi:hypothetical protein